MSWKLVLAIVFVLLLGSGFFMLRSDDVVTVTPAPVTEDTAVVPRDPLAELSCADDLNRILTKKEMVFSDYSATSTYTGVVAALDEESDDSAKRFYSRYQHAREVGVRYGGGYVVAEWAMTGWGHFLGVMDAETGVAAQLPITARFGFEYHPDSLLLVADPISMTRSFAEENQGAICMYFSEPALYPEPKYFLFKDGGFTEVGVNEI